MIPRQVELQWKGTARCELVKEEYLICITYV